MRTGLKILYWDIKGRFDRLIVYPLFKQISPVKKNKIVFCNYGGKGFSDNCMYIAEEIMRRELPYELVWLVKKIEEPMPSAIRKVRFNSYKATYELSTAHVIVNNVKNGLPFQKKKYIQYYIQTWHATYDIKYVERAAMSKLKGNYIKRSVHDSAMTDLFISNSKGRSEDYRKDYWCECDILESGYPRNDILFNFTEKDVKDVYDVLNVSSDYKLVLYAPTFRDDNDFECYRIDCERILEVLKDKYGGKWKMLIRLHPNVWKYSNPIHFTKEIIDASKVLDTNKLLTAIQILITDYSSIMCDFSQLHRPIIRYVLDLEKYKTERGLKPDYFDFPFPLCRSMNELVNALYKLDHGETSSMFSQKMGFVDDGQASRRVVDKIVAVMSKIE